MAEDGIKIGNILYDREKDIRYRVIAITDGCAVLCEMDTTKLNLTTCPPSIIVGLLVDERLEKIEDDNNVIFTPECLSDSVRKKYEQRKALIHDVKKIFGPTYLGLMGKKAKPERDKILQDHQMYLLEFNRIVRNWLQSGMDNSSLVDGRTFATNEGKQYACSTKPGRRPRLCQSGKLLTDEDYEKMDKGVTHYRENKTLSVHKTYIWMCSQYYHTEETGDGEYNEPLLPEDERPTERQFEYYLSKKVSKKDKANRKEGAREFNNKHRIRESDSYYDADFPGDILEIDACEVDTALVSINDDYQAIGRPTVYFAIDVFSHMILGVSVALEQNSVLGLTNLFLNFGDDKVKYCAKYGYPINKKIWPDGIIPDRVRVDRGSEFRSKEFIRICGELDIEIQNVPGATGSYKGIVEASFHQAQEMMKATLQGKGLITADYGSKHYKQAVLNIEEYTAFVLDFIIGYNQKYLKDYPYRDFMKTNGVKPIPVELWEYGVSVNTPRPLPAKERYDWVLMLPVKATLSNEWITYDGLYYKPEGDPKLKNEIFNLHGKTEKMEVRIDPRSVAAVYYMRDNHMITAPLNDEKTGNLDFADCTFAEWEKIQEQKKVENAKGKIYNQNIEAVTQDIGEEIVNRAAKRRIGPANDTNIRPARAEERQKVNANKRMNKELPEQLKEEAEQEEALDTVDTVDVSDDDLMSESEWERYRKILRTDDQNN